ncbi:hypothetical protein MMC22_004625 [Lobaria immixta]|nr:hypothetical protein [Lobaria immixta]
MAEPNNQVVATLTAPAHEHDVDKATSRSQAVATVISIPSLLDLPPELRLMIYRHLLVSPSGLPNCVFPLEVQPLEPRPDVSILRTSKLIHREAFDVLYRENTFVDYFYSPCPPVSRSPRVMNAIHNVEIALDLWAKSIDYEAREMERFLEFGKLYGNHSTIRGTLSLKIYLKPASRRALMWFVRAVSRLQNFKILVLSFDNSSHHVSHVREWLQSALEPVFGPAEVLEKVGYKEKGLIFHPIDHRNLLREPDDADWVEFLKEIPLGGMIT